MPRPTALHPDPARHPPFLHQLLRRRDHAALPRGQDRLIEFAHEVARRHAVEVRERLLRGGRGLGAPDVRLQAGRVLRREGVGEVVVEGGLGAGGADGDEVGGGVEGVDGGGPADEGDHAGLWGEEEGGDHAYAEKFAAGGGGGGGQVGAGGLRGDAGVGVADYDDVGGLEVRD